MPAITLPDGSVRHFDGPVTGTTVAEAIGAGHVMVMFSAMIPAPMIPVLRNAQQ